jgi:phosphatidylserine/phosphatidylglycerophosphate/cardiolipin synthase-like enzyme
VELIIQPDDGPSRLLSALKNAEKSIEVAIFRFDRSDIEEALKAAVARGVKVTALIAGMNRGGEKSLRSLETRFLSAGIIVARTAADLVRYHDKFIIVDRRILYVLSFNFTHLDIEHSRGFGIATTNKTLVEEAGKLFEADCTRKKYSASADTFVVSPANSRKTLHRFLARARKQLLIYDPQISDKQMIGVLQQRAKAGVDVRIIGKIARLSGAQVHKLTRMRLHTRTIIRDGRWAFVGSQSLRPAELDSRRELGLIVRESRLVHRLLATFESDWKAGNGAGEIPAGDGTASSPVSQEAAERVVAVVAHELRPLASTVKKAMNKVVAQTGDDVLRDKIVKVTVKKVIKKAVKQAVKEAVQSAK